MQAALGVDRQQVEPRPERSDHLAADHQQPFAEQRRIALQELMEVLLLQRRAMLDLVVDDLLVAVQGEVVALGDDVRVGHQERPVRARP